MKLFKNKIFLIILSIILLLFSLQFYFISASYKRDTNSYVTLIKWAWTISSSWEKKILKIEEKNQIISWDVINILWNSLAVIEWWDKSVTRLWANSKIIVKENFANEDLSKINISFELLKWQTWSNVISIMSGESYFKQEINWTIAAVRWTVFEANYDSDYLIVHDHEVELTNKAWEKKNLYVWEVFSIKNFSLQNIKILVDDAFTKLNQKMDEDYFKNLRESFLSTMKTTNPLNLVSKFAPENKVYDMLISWSPKENIQEYIANLPQDKKQKVVDKLLELNQVLNFENGENSDLYNVKLNTRGVILENSQDSNIKETLVKYSMYDLSNFFSLWKFNEDVFKNTVWFLYNNKEYMDLQKENLKVLWENSEIFKQIFSLNKEDFSVENLKTTLLNIDASGKEILNKWLNKILDIYKK